MKKRMRSARNSEKSWKGEAGGRGARKKETSSCFRDHVLQCPLFLLRYCYLKWENNIGKAQQK